MEFKQAARDVISDVKELLPDAAILLFLVTMIILISSQVSASSTELNQVLAYWPFDANQNEITGNVSSTSLISSPTHDTGCKINSCYNLNGVSSYLTFTDANFPSGNTEHSCAMWVKQTAYVNDAGLITFGTDAANKRSIFYLPSGGSDGSTGYALYGGGGGSLIPSNSQISNGAWALVGYTKFANGTVDYYFNGIYDGEEVKTGQAVQLGQGTIGNSLQTGGSIFHGQIDEVYCWNYALTPSLHSEFYNRTNTGQQYPFQDFTTIGISSFIADSITNSSLRLVWSISNYTSELNFSITKNGVFLFSSSNYSVVNLSVSGLEPLTTYNFTLYVQGGINTESSQLMATTTASITPPLTVDQNISLSQVYAIQAVKTSVYYFVFWLFLLIMFISGILLMMLGQNIGIRYIGGWLISFFFMLVTLVSTSDNLNFIGLESALMFRVAMVWIFIISIILNHIYLVISAFSEQEKNKRETIYQEYNRLYGRR